MPVRTPTESEPVSPTKGGSLFHRRKGDDGPAPGSAPAGSDARPRRRHPSEPGPATDPRSAWHAASQIRELCACV